MCGFEINLLNFQKCYSMILQLDQVNVEESLSATSLRMMSSSPTTSKELSSKGMKYAKQFQDFTPIDISRLNNNLCFDLMFL